MVASAVMTFTFASRTPGVLESTFWTRAWHAAQVMPETLMVTRTELSFAREVWAAGRAAFAGRRLRVVAVEFMSVLLHDEAAAKHAHAAGELVRSGARRRELDAGPLVRREEATDPEPRDHHFLGATRILPAIEH